MRPLRPIGPTGLTRALTKLKGLRSLTKKLAPFESSCLRIVLGACKAILIRKLYLKARILLIDLYFNIRTLAFERRAKINHLLVILG